MSAIDADTNGKASAFGISGHDGRRIRHEHFSAASFCPVLKMHVKQMSSPLIRIMAGPNVKNATRKHRAANKRQFFH